MHIRNNLALLACALGFAAGATAQEQTGKLKFRAHKNFNFIMPEDVWTPAASGIHAGGATFKTVKDGVKMVVDTSGDGNTNDAVKGSKGYLTFQRKADGKTVRYAARFKGAAGVYTFSSSCSMSGSVGGVSIQLFDLNNNGSYDEVGIDAMIVGGGKAAAYLSKVISNKGKLYNLTVAPGAESATTTPFVGEVGSLDVAGGFHGKGKLESAIVSDGNGNTFNVAGTGSVTVPTGEYTVVSGFVQKGSQTARIRAGKMRGIRVAADKTAKLTWGGPLMAEFRHSLAAGTVSVEPGDLKYYGKAGEEYYDWAPNAKSPKFTVHDPDSGRDLGGFIFAGC